VPQSLCLVAIHIVYSTKYRMKLIPRGIRSDLHAFLAESYRALGSQAFRVGGVDDHVHSVCSLPRTVPISVLVKDTKRTSSLWMKRNGYPDFAWQLGYGAFSVDPSRVERVVAYVDDQEFHHKRESFEDEYLHLLECHGVQFDERYVFD